MPSEPITTTVRIDPSFLRVRVYADVATVNLEAPQEATLQVYGTPLRELTLRGADDGPPAASIMVSTDDGTLQHLALHPDGSAGDFVDGPARDAGTGATDAFEIRVPVVATARVRIVTNDHARVAQLVIDGVEPTTWHVIGDDLQLATNDAGTLAAIVAHAVIPVAVRRRIVLDASLLSEATAHGHVNGTIAAGPGSYHDPSESHEYLESLDGAHNLLLTDGDVVRMLDAAFIPDWQRVHEFPEVPFEVVDRLETAVWWPTETFGATRDDKVLEFCFADASVDRWVGVGPSLVAGIDDAGDLVVLVATKPVIHEMSDWMSHEPHAMPGMPDPAEMQRQMREQFDRELAIATRFAEAPSHPFAGLVHAPAGVRRAMHLRDAEPTFEPYMPPRGLRCVDLAYGDDMTWFEARQANPSASPGVLVRVRLESQAESVPPGMPFEQPDELAMWVDNMTAVARGDYDGDMPLDVSHEVHMEQMFARARALLDETDAATVIVDGIERSARIARTDSGFLLTSEVDGNVLRLAAIGLDGVPELTSSLDLTPFVAGLAEQHQAHARLHEHAFAMDPMGDAPPAAAAMHAEASALLWSLQAGMVPPDVRSHARASEAFDPSIGATHDAARPDAGSWGEQLNALLATCRANGYVATVDRGGTVAHVVVMLELPRPEANMFGSNFAMSGDFWEHDADEVRTAAARRLPRDAMGEHQLELDLLVERGADGTARIATDLLALVDELAGPIQRLVDPVRRD